jgi:outer membrane protein
MPVSHFGNVPTRRIQVKIRAFITWVALAFFCVAPVAFAQGGAPQGGASTNKIAVIRMRDAIQSTLEGKQASAELTAKYAPMQSDIVATQNQVDDISKQLQAGANTLSEEEKERKAAQRDVLNHKAQRLVEELQEESAADTNDAVNRIGKRMLDVQERYARENGYTLVIDSSAGQTMVVMYFAKSIDITDEVVKLYDQQFPVRAAGAAPAPKQPGTPPAQNPPAKRPGGNL